MKAVIIARVSTEEQREAGNSLPAQIKRIENYCERKGLQIVKQFSFDESAYKKKREEFDKILDYIRNQKEIVAVCFDKVDRLSRNVFDKRVSVLYDEAINDKIELHFASDNQVISSRLSAVEKFQFSMSLGLAKYYSDAISDNVKRALEQKLRRGEWPQMAPKGYLNITKDDGKKDIVVDKYLSSIVIKAFELYGTGAYSLDLLRKKLKEDYGVTWAKGFLDKVLKCHFYYGVMVVNGKSYQHFYPQLISKDLFDRVQQIKAGFNKKKFKYAGLDYMYRGLLRCSHCGLSITPEKHKGHVYYHCTQHNGKHGAEWLREENLTEQLGSIFKGLQVPEYVYEKIVEALKTTHEDKADFRDRQFKQLTSEHETYSKRLEKIYLDRLDGRITDDEYDKYYQTFRDKIAEIDTRLGMLQEAEDSYYLTAKYLLELANKAYDLFVSSEVEEKRQIIKLVLSNLRVEGKEVRYEAIKPFDTILNYANSQSWLPLVDVFRNREIEFGFSLESIQSFFERIIPSYDSNLLPIR